jgi:hypothetical protein
MYERTATLTRENRGDDVRLTSLALACRPDAFGFAPVSGYPVGQLGLHVSTQVGFLGANVGIPPTRSVFACPLSVMDLLDLLVRATEILQ